MGVLSQVNSRLCLVECSAHDSKDCQLVPHPWQLPGEGGSGLVAVLAVEAEVTWSLVA